MILPVETINPSETIVPLFGVDESDKASLLGKYVFLGTGAFVGQRPFLVTAEHVVRGWNRPFVITTMPNTDDIMPANLVATNRDVDLAFLEVPGYPPERALKLAQDNEITFNQTVFCLEYSTTRSQRRAIHLSPATRLGNVTRLVDLRERYGKAGEDALELSFPALLGASGAPVVSNSFRIWGVVIANVSYHLLPSQIVTVLDEKNQILEETQFLLPQGLAVHVKHLRAMLQSLH
ncbi:MAG: trypsin-like peptidase domain-containing protein [Chloroflexi bacterium]|nr:trypsin-like peptidase domain-containing protein [Chloroflexota bacterium]